MDKIHRFGAVKSVNVAPVADEDAELDETQLVLNEIFGNTQVLGLDNIDARINNLQAQEDNKMRCIEKIWHALYALQASTAEKVAGASGKDEAVQNEHHRIDQIQEQMNTLGLRYLRWMINGALRRLDSLLPERTRCGSWGAYHLWQAHLIQPTGKQQTSGPRQRQLS
ncbi:hypothetical protein ACJX0J_038904, partial [Zea mays]